MVQTRLPSRYRVIEEVGQGGMAVVYRAQDETLKREVAIKVLHPHLLAEPESKARLEREAQAVAKLQHDNILQVFDYSGSNALSSYIVTEFIDGQTLKQFFSARKTPRPEIAALIAIELGTALAHAHKLGIIHRDIKPENVMVRKDGMLKLMDFGVAQILDLERMTVTGQLLGSPAYMAPELFEGKPLDVRTDVFSVGVMLYQMATGQLPFSGRNPHEVLKRIAEGRFPDPRTLNRLVADRLTRIISRALAKKPDDRYPSVDALVTDLKAYVADGGLENSRDEIKHFVVDPDGYEASLGKRIVCALVATGRREQVAGRLARALECWNRALAIDPQNHDVLKALRKIEGRRRIYRAAVIVGGAGLLSGLIWGAFKVAREDVPAPIANAMRGPAPKEKPPTPKARDVGPPTPAQRPIADAKPPPKRQGMSPIPRSPAATHPDNPAPAQPAVTPATRTFTLAPNPLRVEVLLDGVPQPDFDPWKHRLTVDWKGVHKVELRNDECCERLVVELGPNTPNKLVDLDNNKIIGVLPRKVGNVTIRLQPPRDDVQIELRELGDGPGAMRPIAAKNGDPVPIRFDAKSEVRKTMQVSVYMGDKTVRQTFELRAGEKDKEVRVPLE
jgi:tRNA A-37 threonylcarbamoyl transferase component Bud32